jgi:hypothetical protein
MFQWERGSATRSNVVDRVALRLCLPAEQARWTFAIQCEFAHLKALCLAALLRLTEPHSGAVSGCARELLLQQCLKSLPGLGQSLYLWFNLAPTSIDVRIVTYCQVRGMDYTPERARRRAQQGGK